jgi:hypothetical protein
LPARPAAYSSYTENGIGASTEKVMQLIFTTLQTKERK